jgi:hypothetical protein
LKLELKINNRYIVIIKIFDHFSLAENRFSNSNKNSAPDIIHV